MHVLLALECAAGIVECVNYLSRKLVGHGLSATLAGVRNEVLHRNGLLAVSTDFGRDLECSTTYTA